VIWHNNLLKGVLNNSEYVGIGIEVGAHEMKIYNNTTMSQWPTEGYAFGVRWVARCRIITPAS